MVVRVGIIVCVLYVSLSWHMPGGRGSRAGWGGNITDKGSTISAPSQESYSQESVAEAHLRHYGRSVASATLNALRLAENMSCRRVWPRNRKLDWA